LSDNVELLKRIYDRFNARDLETLLAALHEDVIWANGMEGGMSTGAKEYAVTGRGSGQWSIRTLSRVRLWKAQKRK
jgi:ketosteroid isomerase-like protein